MSGYDVYGVGHALVDLLFCVDSDRLEALGVRKGIMTLVDAQRRQAILKGLAREPDSMASGGSAANTAIAVARFGGTACYAFQVGGDAWGRFYREDLLSAGVDSSPSALRPGETGQCLVMVTPDADRSMNTFLGASALMGPHQVDAEVAGASRVVYLEGYLLTTESGLAACQAAAGAAQRRGVPVSLTLSDPSVVAAYRARFEELLGGGRVELLFCNEREATVFTGCADPQAAAARLAGRARCVCVTLGSRGALAIDEGAAPVHVPGHAVPAVDTTGAGDSFAGGVLYGITHGRSLEEAARLGNYAAAVVVSAFGPRLEAPLQRLVDAILEGCAPPPSSLPAPRPQREVET